ncbi:2abd913c-2603-4eee-b194-f4f8eb83d4d2-CDS [Sclerotinia trifoliorum]|uniref:2abd913c-2603-4eee-b194-f4f8eb83d4d2-CDS n=1 Tax=Sclerotinia trifoliorum TaxID=28548 RepID=A0A8H2W4Y8_9HELO|nr:2abd913c-2603-4eee-b194-f4f8eb83d4d2-CDS [Sclerotinia trifoliorum]
METNKDTLYPKISGKPKNLMLEFSKYQKKTKGRRATSISVTGTVKLHGTHTDFLIHANDTIQFQTRNNENFTADMDTIGFVPFAQMLKPQILHLKKQIYVRFSTLNPKAKLDDAHPLIIAGEFIGPNVQKHVAISALPRKCFVIISVSINNEWQLDEQYADIHNESVGIFNVSRGGFFHETITIRNPQPAFEKMQALADAVEKECPFAKSFGIIGLGEGIVWKPTAPLCHDAKYWLKLKGPISIGTAVAGPAARMPQRSGFVTPIFSTPTPPAKRGTPSRTTGNTTQHRGDFVVSEFPPLNPAEASRVPPNQSDNMISSQSPNLRLPLSETNPTPWKSKNATVGTSRNSKPGQIIVSVTLAPGTVNMLLSENSKPNRGTRPALVLAKDGHRSLESPKNVEGSIFPVFKVAEGAAPVSQKLTESTKSTQLTPELIRQARSEIMDLIQSGGSGASSMARYKVDELTPEVSSAVKSITSSPATSEGSSRELSKEEEEIQAGWSLPLFSKRVNDAEPEDAKSTPLAPILEQFDKTSLKTVKPIHLPLKFKTVEILGLAAARSFAYEVVRDRRLEQAWQFLCENQVPRDRNGVVAFLKWLYHDIAVEEKGEIEEMKIDRSFLKKEIEMIGREWYFEELLFKEHDWNFNIGAVL